MTALVRAESPSRFTKMAVGAVSRTVNRFPRSTVTAANTVGLLMTLPGIRRVVKLVLGRNYDLGAARRIVFPNVDLDIVDTRGIGAVRVARPENRYGSLTPFLGSEFVQRWTSGLESLSSPARKSSLEERERATSWAEYRGGSHFYSGKYTLKECIGAFFGIAPLLPKLSQRVLQVVGATSQDLSRSQITSGLTRTWN